MLICVLSSCSSFQHVSRQSYHAFAVFEIPSHVVEADTTDKPAPLKFKRKYDIIYGLIFGSVGFATLGFVGYKFGADPECYECEEDFFWIGGAIGGVAGLVTGLHVGHRRDVRAFKKQKETEE